jgi:hypothetical protein
MLSVGPYAYRLSPSQNVHVTRPAQHPFGNVHYRQHTLTPREAADGIWYGGDGPRDVPRRKSGRPKLDHVKGEQEDVFATLTAGQPRAEQTAHGPSYSAYQALTQV